MRRQQNTPLPFLAAACCLLSVWGKPAQAQHHTSHVRILEVQNHTEHPTLGPEDAPVQIEYFFHLNSGRHSARSYQAIRELAKRHPKRLRVIFRLTDRRQTADSVQQMAREAFVQGRFFAFLEAYFAKPNGMAISAYLPEVAKQARLDFAQLQAAVDSGTHLEFLRSNHYYWRKVPTERILTILVRSGNGSPVPMPIETIDTLETIYDRAFQNTLPAVEPEAVPIRIGALDSDYQMSTPAPTPIPMTELLRGHHRRGAETAPVKLVFICHMQSLLCRMMGRYLDDIRESFPGQVQIIYQPLFDNQRPGQKFAQKMYESALCADEQDAMWEYTARALRQQRRRFDLPLAMANAAETNQIEAKQFERCLISPKVKAQAEEEVALVRRAGVRVTPALAVGGVLYSGRLLFSDLRLIVNRELAKGRLQHIDLWNWRETRPQ